MGKFAEKIGQEAVCVQDCAEFQEEDLEFPERGKERGVRNKRNWSKALRKRRIDASRPSSHFVGKDGKDSRHYWYGNLHEYGKGKIHCSCPLCRPEAGTRKFSDARRADAARRESDAFARGEAL